MKIKIEGLTADISKEKIESICNTVAEDIGKENDERWSGIVQGLIEEQTAKEDDRDYEIMCHSLADVTPLFMREYVKLFVQKTLIEMFCEDS